MIIEIDRASSAFACDSNLLHTVKCLHNSKCSGDALHENNASCIDSCDLVRTMVHLSQEFVDAEAAERCL